MAKKKRTKSMDELAEGYEKFIQKREVREDGKEFFEKVVRKATKKK